MNHTELSVKTTIEDIEPKLDKNFKPYFKLSLRGFTNPFYAFSYHLSPETLTMLKEKPEQFTNQLALIAYQELPNLDEKKLELTQKIQILQELTTQLEVHEENNQEAGKKSQQPTNYESPKTFYLPVRNLTNYEKPNPKRKISLRKESERTGKISKILSLNLPTKQGTKNYHSFLDFQEGKDDQEKEQNAREKIAQQIFNDH
ncbi:6499_t:CDS:2 [Funneliformis geosporum]|uniref:8175_t:CDS:1 n=1 Tax=Funneliformis geosporum TaxID=1117311 RepID=A0A9W4WUI6_9GLOM|nr:8175_t:CDS:2 [Funneliformis geosporum]CAI2195875.1 6499_t:CDS:2 [Funneliformis geosporum]